MFAALTVVLILLAATRWILEHPYGVHWDEAFYFNQVVTSIWRLHSGKLREIAGVILGGGDSNRPPAYRLLVLPFLSLFGLHIATARFASLAVSGLSAWFIYSATRRIASPAAGAFALLVFSLSPEVVSASIFFGTEAPLFLATSSMLYFLFVTWSDRTEQPGTWIWLGLAIGLGLLSKSSFILIAFPVLTFALIARSRKHPHVPSVASLFKSGALAFLVAAPWWLRNFGSALHYARFASRDWTRSSLGTPSLGTWARWFSTVLQGLLGHGLSILIGLVVVVFLRKVILKREAVLDPVQRTALLACACAGLPLIVVQLSGTNHLLRHISPAMIPLAIAVGVLADKTGWIHSKASVAISGILLSAQLLMIVAPVVVPNRQPVDPGFVNGGLPWRVMVRFDQWNWKPLQDISHNCDLETPRIALLGNGRAFNESQISYPWIVEGASPPEVKWLWRYEQGPLDWQKVMGSVEGSDVVLTAPDYIGQVTDKQDVDNQHNAEFARRLDQDSRFREPVRLEMGRFEPVEVMVFLKKSLVCHSGVESPSKQ